MAQPDYKAIARQSASKYGLDPKLFVRQIGAESGFRTDRTSSAGAQGIAQIMPATAKGWGVDPNDPVAALDAAARAMAKYVKSYGSYKSALVAYNAGPSHVGKPLHSETRDYIAKIMGNLPDQTKVTKGKTWSAAGETTTPTSTTTTMPGMPAAQAAALRTVFRSSSDSMRGILEAAIGEKSKPVTVTTSSPTPAGGSARVAAAPRVAGGPGSSYKDLATFLQRNFGARLDNPDLDDPNNRQTTGGRHDPDGNHPKGLAVDLGDAKNDIAKMRRIAAYAKRNPEHFDELYFNKLGWGIRRGKIIKGLVVDGHDDHMHLAVRRPVAKKAAA